MVKKPKDEAKAESALSEGARRADALETGVVASEPVDTSAPPKPLKADLTTEPSRANDLKTSVIASSPLAKAKEAPLKLGDPLAKADEAKDGAGTVTGAGTGVAPSKPASTGPDTTALAKPASKSETKPAPSQPAPSQPATSKPDTAKAEPMTSKSDSKPTETKAATPAAAPADAKPAPRPVTVKRVGFFPLFFGGVVAAGLGAGAAYYAIPKLPPQWQPMATPVAPAAPAIDVEAIRADAVSAARDAATQAAQASLANLTETAQAAGAEAAKAALADLPPPEGAPVASVDLTPLQEALAQQAAQIKALDEALAGAAATGTGEGVPPAALAGLETAVAQMQEHLAGQAAKIDELAARPVGGDPEQMAGIAQQIETAAAEAEARIRAAEAAAAKLKDEAEATGQRSRAVAALALLQSAVETGSPRDTALNELAAAGVTVPEALQAEVPTLAALRHDFPAASRAALAASLKAASADEGAMGKVANFLKVQTGARSVEPQEGSGPDAVLSRAEAKVQAADIAGALAEIAALPQAGQEATRMAAWVTLARTYTDAQAAVSDLSRELK